VVHYNAHGAAVALAQWWRQPWFSSHLGLLICSTRMSPGQR